MNRCSITGQIIEGSSDAIWDDGEWVNWDWINNQLYENELQEQYPNASLDLIRVFEELVAVAADYKEITGRYLPVFGELGEIFAEITFGIKRNKPKAQGSDGRLGNDFVEVKTISPEKSSKKVTVKRSGNFNKLCVVKINEHFKFEARILDRKDMKKGTGKVARVSWSSLKAEQ